MMHKKTVNMKNLLSDNTPIRICLPHHATAHTATAERSRIGAVRIQ